MQAHVLAGERAADPVSHAPTPGEGTAGFAAGEPLDERGQAWAAQARDRLRRVTATVCSPAPACRQTAAALGLSEARDEPRLRDWDLGRWRGRTLDQVAATEPEAVQTWLSTPAAAPHGGEALTALLARVEDWLGHPTPDGHTVALTHPAVIRAAILATLAGAPAGFWRIDIAPLTATVLRGRPGHWTLRASGHPLIARDPGGTPEPAR